MVYYICREKEVEDMKKGKLVIITTYVNGVCKNIERKFPRSDETALEMVDKLKVELPAIPNGKYKIEI